MSRLTVSRLNNGSWYDFAEIPSSVTTDHQKAAVTAHRYARLSGVPVLMKEKEVSAEKRLQLSGQSAICALVVRPKKVTRA